MTTTQHSQQRRARHEERGATMVEYVLLIGLLVIGALVGIEQVGQSTDDTFQETAVAFESNDAPPPAEGDDEAAATGEEGDEDAGGTEGTSGGTGGSGGSGGTSGGTEGTSGGTEGTEGGTEGTEGGTEGTEGGTEGTEEEDDEAAITESAGIFGQFQANFVIEDDEVELDSVEAEGWTYRITRDEPGRMVLKFTNTETRERFKVRCWITSDGLLTSTVVPL